MERRIYGLEKAMAGEMLEFTSSEHGESVTGVALNLEEDNIGAVILGDYLKLKEGDEVRRTARVLEVPVGPALIGRVVDPLGRPIDGHGEVRCILLVLSFPDQLWIERRVARIAKRLRSLFLVCHEVAQLFSGNIGARILMFDGFQSVRGILSFCH